MHDIFLLKGRVAHGAGILRLQGKQVSPSTQSVMRQIFDFVKTTVVGGAIFLLPFAAVLLVVIKAGTMAVDSATPLAEKLPISKARQLSPFMSSGLFCLC